MNDDLIYDGVWYGEWGDYIGIGIGKSRIRRIAIRMGKKPWEPPRQAYIESRKCWANGSRIRIKCPFCENISYVNRFECPICGAEKRGKKTWIRINPDNRIRQCTIAIEGRKERLRTFAGVDGAIGFIWTIDKKEALRFQLLSGFIIRPQDYPMTCDEKIKSPVSTPLDCSLPWKEMDKIEREIREERFLR